MVPGRGAGTQRVDHDDQVRAVELGQEIERIAERPDVVRSRHPLGDPSCDEGADTVVAAVLAPEAGDEDPRGRSSSRALHQVEEVGGARYARIVVAHRLLATPLQFVVAQVQPALDHPSKIVLDRELVLRGGWHDPRARIMPSSSISY